MTEIRRARFAVSVDALLQQWARQEGAPAGTALIASTEIAGRIRGGVEWRHDESVAVGVLARPRALEPSEVELGWLAAGLGAAAALDQVTGGHSVCLWPDRVVGTATDDREHVDAVVSSAGHLGPGRVDDVVLIARVAGLADVADGLGEALVAELRSSARLLDEPTGLVEQYRHRCATLGRRVSMTLLPHGTTRGLARDVSLEGALLVESPTGLTEPIPVATLGRLETLDG
ncbi:MAG: hypothetical protein HKN41_09985 [Ilumatobacter sp.]|nr:hypothetical protein [Ilumatobacter sp.]